jgi:transaldolase
MPLSLLQQLENAGLKIDVDTMDPLVSSSLPFVPNDMTSNQKYVDLQIQDPANEDFLRGIIRERKGEGWEVVYDVAVGVHFRSG